MRVTTMLRGNLGAGSDITSLTGGMAWLSDGLVGQPGAGSAGETVLLAPKDGLPREQLEEAAVVAYGCPKCNQLFGAVYLLWVSKA